MISKEVLDLIAKLLRKGYKFYDACRAAGLVEPSEFSEAGRELSKRRKSGKRRVIHVYKRVTPCYNQYCKGCSDDTCVIRTQDSQ